MILNATEIKNNFGKMLKLLDFEDILIKKNGRVVAKVMKYEEHLDEYNMIKEEALVYNLGDQKVSYEAFLKLAATSDQRYELINGQVYLLASPRITHQMIVGQIYAQIYTKMLGEKCQPFISPFDITLTVDKKINVVQPDIGIICDMADFTDEQDRYMGIPTMVAEVLSESSVTKDMVHKLHIYMLSGVKEYWVINPMEDSVMVYAFKDYEIVYHKSFKREDGIKSYYLPGVEVKW